jgi:hypothetical protein
MPIVRTLPHLTLAVAAAALLGAFAEPEAVVATTNEIRAARTATNPIFFNIHTLLVSTPLTGVRRSVPAEVCVAAEVLARDSTPLCPGGKAIRLYRLALCATASRPTRPARRVTPLFTVPEFRQRLLRFNGGGDEHRDDARDEVLYVLEGSGLATVGGDELALEPGTGVFVARGTPGRSSRPTA